MSSSIIKHRHRGTAFGLMLITFGMLLGLTIYSQMSAAAQSGDLYTSQSMAGVQADKVFVDKSERILQLMHDGKVLKTYRIALGDNPVGHKQVQGDERTPTGRYTLDYKNENSIAYRSIHISYPNAADRAHAAKLGASPGGDIMIHGQMNGFGHLAWLNQQRDWTDGCIAVSNEEMDEIMAAVAVGVPIEIVE